MNRNFCRVFKKSLTPSLPSPTIFCQLASFKCQINTSTRYGVKLISIWVFCNKNKYLIPFYKSWIFIESLQDAVEERHFPLALCSCPGRESGRKETEKVGSKDEASTVTSGKSRTPRLKLKFVRLRKYFCMLLYLVRSKWLLFVRELKLNIFAQW